MFCVEHSEGLKVYKDIEACVSRNDYPFGSSSKYWRLTAN